MRKAVRNSNIAQLILSLATTPDRAATTVGDLLEEADTRGSLWFWSSVLRTACSLCWRDFFSAPLRMLWLGLRGFLAVSFWSVFPLGLVGLVFTRPNSSPLMNPLLVWPPLIASEIFGAVWAGWGVAKSSKGRELAAAFSVTITVAAFYALAEYLSALQLRRIGQPYPGREYAFAQDCLEVFFVILGAVLFRSRKTTEPTRFEPKRGAHA
jgi:hypothetical protein